MSSGLARTLDNIVAGPTITNILVSHTQYAVISDLRYLKYSSKRCVDDCGGRSLGSCAWGSGAQRLKGL